MTVILRCCTVAEYYRWRGSTPAVLPLYIANPSTTFCTDAHRPWCVEQRAAGRCCRTAKEHRRNRYGVYKQPGRVSRLSDADVIAIRASSACDTDIAQQYGVSANYIGKIQRGVSRVFDRQSEAA